MNALSLPSLVFKFKMNCEKHFTPLVIKVTEEFNQPTASSPMSDPTLSSTLPFILLILQQRFIRSVLEH